MLNEKPIDSNYSAAVNKGPRCILYLFKPESKKEKVRMKMILVDAVDTALFERIKTRGPIGQLRPIGLIYDQKR